MSQVEPPARLKNTKLYGSSPESGLPGRFVMVWPVDVGRPVPTVATVSEFLFDDAYSWPPAMVT